MLKNHLTTSIQYFRKHKSFLIINLVGLTIGLTAFYFAFLYVNFELSYDSSHQNADNIYRLVIDVNTPNGVDYRGTPAPIAQAVEEAFPEVESATGILLDHLILQNEVGVQNDEKIGYTDSSLFSVFTFPLINRNPGEVLNAPFQIVLSESCANKYFGEVDPLGKSLLINGKDRAYVTGIMKDMPLNSHFRVDALVSISTLLKVWRPDLKHSWKSRRANTYLTLHEDADPKDLNAKITQLLRSKIDQTEYEYNTALEPLRSVYLYGKPRGSSAGSAITGNITNVYICALAAILVLFIASLNYVNLSTAFSMRRAKEIGLRKLLGASRPGLTAQFLTDAIVLSLLAFVVALGLSTLITPVFNQISGKTISRGIWEYPAYLGILLLVAVVSGVLSGLYPAFFLSAFKPIGVLKGRFTSSIKGIRLRKILVTSQFLLSFTLIVATSVLYRQLHFMQNQQLGFKKDHMLAINFQADDQMSTE
ncbi:MAG: ABC transporter permease, partial [Lewinella sp.]|nr:ABC transporter permease [Lewinella sp.]